MKPEVLLLAQGENQYLMSNPYNDDPVIGDDNEDVDTYAALDEALTGRDKAFYTLRLYISGNTIRSSRAIQNIQKICHQRLAGRYELEVIDIFQQPHLAIQAQIIVAPTLIRQLPLPLRKLVGDMADEKRTLVGLDIFENDKDVESSNLET
jgi:circadian clock protein KaiB